MRPVHRGERRPGPATIADPRLTKRAHAAAGIIAAITAAAGTAVLAGWALGTPALRALLPNQTLELRPAGGVLLISIGICLLALVLDAPRAVIIISAAAATAVGAAATIVSFAQRPGTPLDLLGAPPEFTGTAKPLTGGAVIAAMIGLALLLTAIDRLPNLRQTIAAVAASMSATIMFAYLLDVPVLDAYVRDVSNRMALGAALVLGLAALAAVLAGIESGWLRIFVSPRIGGRASRFLLPFFVVLILLLGTGGRVAFTAGPQDLLVSIDVLLGMLLGALTLSAIWIGYRADKIDAGRIDALAIAQREAARSNALQVMTSRLALPVADADDILRSAPPLVLAAATGSAWCVIAAVSSADLLALKGTAHRDELQEPALAAAFGSEPSPLASSETAREVHATGSTAFIPQFHPTSSAEPGGLEQRLAALAPGSLICTPVNVSGRVAALMFLGTQAQRRATDDDRAFAEQVTEIISLAYESAVLVQRLAAANQILDEQVIARTGSLNRADALQQMTDRLTRAVNHPELAFDDIARIVLDAVPGASYASIAELGSETGLTGGAIALAHVNPQAEQYLRDALADSSGITFAPARDLLTSGGHSSPGEPAGATLIPGTQVRAALPARYQPYAERFGLGALIQVPITASSGVFGLLAISAGTDGEFTAEDVTFAESIARVLGLAVTTAGLWKRITEANDDLAEQVRQRSAQAARSDAVRLITTDLTAAVASPDELMQIAADAVVAHMPSAYSSARLEVVETEAETEAETETETGAVIHSPIYAGGTIVARLAISAPPGVAPTSEDQEFADQTANVIALSLQTARLWSELGDAKEYLEDRVESRTADLEAARAQLEGTVTALNRSNEELSRFAYVASHDLQAPLRTVGGFTEVLIKSLSDGQLTDQQLQMASLITDGTVRMQRLLRDLLQYSRLETTGREREILDVAEIHDEAMAMLADRAEAAGATLTCASSAPVFCSPRQFRQLLTSLLKNGIDHRSPDRAPVVTTSCRSIAGGMTEITVTDNGRGIDPKDFERIFDMFKQLRKSEGTGIGLTLVARIVELAGGSVRVESDGSSGSSFIVTLPSAPAGDQPAPGPRAGLRSGLRSGLADDV